MNVHATHLARDGWRWQSPPPRDGRPRLFGPTSRSLADAFRGWIQRHEAELASGEAMRLLAAASSIEEPPQPEARPRRSSSVANLPALDPAPQRPRGSSVCIASQAAIDATATELSQNVVANIDDRAPTTPFVLQAAEAIEPSMSAAASLEHQHATLPSQHAAQSMPLFANVAPDVSAGQAN